MNPSRSYFILATAGHVDHGKSALVKALTGTDPDRLPEEKARGITIDLGFAHLLLRGPGSLPQEFYLGLVDVPGHEDFVANMVAGVGSIDLALLVVAADDGWMPQTEEHLQILSYLGVTKAVVALTKIDLVGADDQLTINAVRERLAGSPFADARIVPTSVVSGQGIEDLKAALGALLCTIPPQRDLGKPRLAVDRAFTLRGIGSVVTGTLTGGSFEQGQTVMVQPSSHVTRIRTIQSHNEDLASIGPARRCALSLFDVAVARQGSAAGNAESGVRRGQVITLPAFGKPARELDVLLDRFHRPISNRAGDLRPLRSGARVRLHHGTANIPGHVLFADGKEIGPGERMLAELRLDWPVFAFTGDRFILRDWPGQTTLAGGTVLDPEPNRRRFGSSNQREFLRSVSTALNDPSLVLEAWMRRDRLAQPGTVLVRTHFTAEQVVEAITGLQSTGRLIAAGEFIAHSDFWNDVRRQAIETIDGHHRAHPEQPGLPLGQLRSVLADQFPLPEAFDALLLELCNRGFARLGTIIKRTGHGPALPSHLAAAAQQIRRLLTAKPLDPPSRKELVSSIEARQALGFLIASGQAVEVGPDIVLLSEAYETGVELIRKTLGNGNAATVSQLRQTLGSSRRVMVPFLEKLDREGITRRQGDVRVLGSKP